MIRKLKMDYPELNNAQIAKRSGCTTNNVRLVLSRFLDANSEDDFREYQENKADVFDAIQHRIHMSIRHEDIAKAPLLARVTSAAILEDKARTIRGQATQINVSVLLDAVNAARELQDKREAEAMAAVHRRLASEAGK